MSRTAETATVFLRGSRRGPTDFAPHVNTLNALGFCVGGTLLSAATAVLRARGDQRLASVTLLATLLDYRDSGDLGTLVDGE